MRIREGRRLQKAKERLEKTSTWTLPWQEYCGGWTTTNSSKWLGGLLECPFVLKKLARVWAERILNKKYWMQLQNQEDERMEEVKCLLCLIFFYITYLRWSHAFLTKQKKIMSGNWQPNIRLRVHTLAQMQERRSFMLLYSASSSRWIGCYPAKNWSGLRLMQILRKPRVKLQKVRSVPLYEIMESSSVYQDHASKM